MSSALYLVIRSRGSWWVDLEGTASGPFATFEPALDEARHLARNMARAGRRSEVLVPNEVGRYVVDWDSTKVRNAAA